MCHAHHASRKCRRLPSRPFFATLPVSMFSKIFCSIVRGVVCYLLCESCLVILLDSVFETPCYIVWVLHHSSWSLAACCSWYRPCQWPSRAPLANRPTFDVVQKNKMSNLAQWSRTFQFILWIFLHPSPTTTPHHCQGLSMHSVSPDTSEIRSRSFFRPDSRSNNPLVRLPSARSPLPHTSCR